MDDGIKEAVANEAKMGYHLTEITRGQYGTSGKLLEEVVELQDAEAQQSKIMALVELSDLYAAIMGYLEHNYPTITMDDLANMAQITKRAFDNGYRTPKE